MNIASRTPEGLPNRCPVCGNNVRIEPSIPSGDAPCPSCGVLLWFRERFPALGPSLWADSRFIEDLRADSLDLVELVMEIEDTFSISVPDDEYSSIKTVGDAMRLIERRRELSG